MKLRQAFIAPAAGIAVITSSIAAFGAAFGILLGGGLATITIVTGSLLLSTDEGIEGGDEPTAHFKESAVRR